MQLEDELREVLRQRKAREVTNYMRIKFREIEHKKKLAEDGEKKREKEVEEMEKDNRLESLRRVARRRLGLHLMPKDNG